MRRDERMGVEGRERGRVVGHVAERVRRTRQSPDEAAVLVEFAFALPILMLFLLGIFEFGFGWRQKIFVERAAQSGGRTAASTANDRLADFDALRAVDSQLSGAGSVELERVVIWKATSFDSEVPPACEGGTSVAGLCNVYTAAQVQTALPTGFGTSGGTCRGGSWDSAWCPTTRDNTPPGADLVGIAVYAKYSTITNILPVDDLDFFASGVYHLEPPYVGR